MSTALRIVILVVEILAYILIFFLKFRRLKKKKSYVTKDNKKYVITSTTQEDIAILEMLISCTIMIAFVVWLYPQHIFLSYKKLASIAGFVIINFFYFLNFELEKDWFKRKKSTRAYILLFILALIFFIVAPNTEKQYNPKEIVDMDLEQYIYRVEEQLKPIGDGKIAEVVDESGKTTSYFFIMEDKEGNEIIEVVDRLKLSSCLDIYPDEDARIEKYVDVRKYTYPELKEETIEEEVRIEYRFYINPELITQIQM